VTSNPAPSGKWSSCGDASDDYPEAEIIGGTFLSSLVSLILTFLFFHASVFWFVPVSLALFFPSRFLLRKFTRLKRPFLGPTGRRSGQEKAFAAFHEHGLDTTRRKRASSSSSPFLKESLYPCRPGSLFEIGQETLDRYAGIIVGGGQRGTRLRCALSGDPGHGPVAFNPFPYHRRRHQ